MADAVEEAREWAQLLRDGIRMTRARRDVVADLLLTLAADPDPHDLGSA